LPHVTPNTAITPFGRVALTPSIRGVGLGVQLAMSARGASVVSLYVFIPPMGFRSRLFREGAKLIIGQGSAQCALYFPTKCR